MMWKESNELFVIDLIKQQQDLSWLVTVWGFFCQFVENLHETKLKLLKDVACNNRYCHCFRYRHKYFCHFYYRQLNSLNIEHNPLSDLDAEYLTYYSVCVITVMKNLQILLL